MKEASVRDVLVSGAGGGVAFWAYTVYRGGQPAGEMAPFGPGEWLWISLGLTIILGAAAAFLMVYFIANTDTKDRMRAIGFAAACGLCWEPVLAGVVERFTRDYGDAVAAKKVAEARQLPPGSAPGSAARIAAELVRVAPAVQNPVLRAEVAAQTERLLAEMERIPDPRARTEALQEIGIAAAEAQQTAPLARTVKSLEMIADTQPAHARQARGAIATIESRAAEFERR